MFVAGTSTHKVGEVAQTLMGVAPAIPVSPWRAWGNGCMYRAGGDAGSASPV